MIFKSKEDVRPQCDERIPLVDLELGGKAWDCQAHGGRTGFCSFCWVLPCSRCAPSARTTSNFGFWAGPPDCFATGRTLFRRENPCAVRSGRRTDHVHCRRRIAGWAVLLYIRGRDLLVPLMVITPILVGFAGARVLLWPDSLPLRMAVEVGLPHSFCLTASVALLRARRGRWDPSAWLLALCLPSLHLSWPPFTDSVPKGAFLGCGNCAGIKHAAGCIRPGPDANPPAARGAGDHRQRGQRPAIWECGAVRSRGIAAVDASPGRLVPSARRRQSGRDSCGRAFLRFPARRRLRSCE